MEYNEPDQPQLLPVRRFRSRKVQLEPFQNTDNTQLLLSRFFQYIFWSETVSDVVFVWINAYNPRKLVSNFLLYGIPRKCYRYDIF